MNPDQTYTPQQLEDAQKIAAMAAARKVEAVSDVTASTDPKPKGHVSLNSFKAAFQAIKSERRNKYTPHVGAKQQAKFAKKGKRNERPM